MLARLTPSTCLLRERAGFTQGERSSQLLWPPAARQSCRAWHRSAIAHVVRIPALRACWLPLGLVYRKCQQYFATAPSGMPLLHRRRPTPRVGAAAASLAESRSRPTGAAGCAAGQDGPGGQQALLLRAVKRGEQ
jgi:hypothetical protein